QPQSPTNAATQILRMASLQRRFTYHIYLPTQCKYIHDRALSHSAFRIPRSAFRIRLFLLLDGAGSRPTKNGLSPTTTMMQGAIEDISKAVGNTPIVRLNKVTAGLDVEIYVKCEYLNP